MQPQLRATGSGIGWEALAAVFRDPSIGGSTALAMAWLWELAGSRPSTIVATAVGLGAQFGRSARAAWDWLEKLAAHRLIEILDRDERRGVITLYVFDPREPEACRVRRPDPQPLLAGMEEEQASGVSAQKPPSTLKLARVSAQEPSSETVCSGVSAQKPPSEAAKWSGGSGVCAQKPPSETGDLHGSPEGSLAGACPSLLGEAIGLGHLKVNGPRAALQIPKNKELTVPILPKTKYQETRPGVAQEGAAVEERAGASGPRQFAELSAAAIDLAIDRMTNPQQQANRLAARVLDAIPELRPTGAYLADYVARLVAVERRLEVIDLDRLLGHVGAMRRAGTIRTDAAALFNGLLRKQLKELGIAWCPNGEFRQRE